MYTPPPNDGPRSRRRALSATERSDILAALKAGGSVSSAATRFGLDRATVRRIRDGAGGGGASGSACVVVTTRLSAAEARAFEARLAALGLRSRSEGLRAAVRVASGFLEFSREENAGLDELTRELNKIGVNVNQLARLANSGRLPVGGRPLDVLSELRREVSQLRAFLLDLTAERRRRGTKLFEQYQRAERADG